MHRYIEKALVWSVLHERGYRIILAGVSLLLLIPNLGETYLWTDEAYTAAIARNTLHYGLPLVHDGRNLIQYYPSVHNEQYIDVVSPPLSYYITATSFALLGVSNTSARLPFVLAGVIAILIFPGALKRLTEDTWTRAVSPLALATFVPFLLYFRQCRYYSVMIMATIWLIWAYLRLMEDPDKKRWHALHLTLSSLVLFHSHYIVCLGTFIGLGIHWLLMFRRQYPWKTLLRFGIWFGLFSVPWILYAQATISSSFTARYLGDTSLRALTHRICHFLAQITSKTAEDFFPPLLLILLIILLGRHETRWWSRLAIASCLCAIGVSILIPGAIYLLTLCIGTATLWGLIRLIKGRWRVTRQSLIWTLPLSLLITLAFISPSDEVRYMIGVVPLLFAGVIMTLGKLRLRFPVMSVILLLLFLYTSVFRSAASALIALTPFSAMRTGAALAESEWSHRFNIPSALPEERDWYHRTAVMDEAIAQRAPVYSYLYEYFYELTHQYDGPVEGISSYLNRYGSPDDTVKIDSDAVTLIFYVNKMIILPEHRFMDRSVQADWVILRASNWNGIPAEFMREIERDYDRVTLTVPDLPWENRPELAFHHFRIPQGRWPPVVLYRYRAMESGTP